MRLFPSKRMLPDSTPLCVSIWCTACDYALMFCNGVAQAQSKFSIAWSHFLLFCKLQTAKSQVAREERERERIIYKCTSHPLASKIHKQSFGMNRPRTCRGSTSMLDGWEVVLMYAIILSLLDYKLWLRTCLGNFVLECLLQTIVKREESMST